MLSRTLAHTVSQNCTLSSMYGFSVVNIGCEATFEPSCTIKLEPLSHWIKVIMQNREKSSSTVEAG
jgi:hypothetical protein